MKKKVRVFLILAAVACNTHGAYDFALGQLSPFKSITVTPTNLTIKLQGRGWVVLSDADAVWASPTMRRSEEYVENDESLIATPDKRIMLNEHHGGYIFAPVAFKNGLKGFKIDFDGGDHGGEAFSRDWHIVLSDTPIEVGEDDVEMIMEEGKKWKKVEKPQPVATSGPAEVNPPEPAMPPQTPVITAVSPQPLGGEEENVMSRLWLYLGAGILLLSCAAVRLVRGKTKS